jgi:TolA-binding protein
MKYLSIVLAVLMITSCTPSKEKLQKNIANAEAELFKNDKGTFVFDDKLAVKTIDAYSAFAEAYPEDSLTPEYLFKKADLFRSVKDAGKSIETYNAIIEKYPNYKKAPYCLFLKGFIFENELNNTAKAKESYEAFLAKYPTHDLADDVQFSLNNLGKSPEQLIREFKEKQQQMLNDTSVQAI